METLKKKINKINKEQPLLSIEEIMRLMEEFYDKYDGDFDLPSIDFEFENHDYLKFYIDREPICGGYFPLWYIKLSCTNNLTLESLETPPIFVDENVYDLLKKLIGDNVIDSKIKHIGMVL